MKRYCTSRLVRRLKDSRGANIVEMALVLPLLFLVTFSIIEFASLMYAYLALENGVAQAVRFGVTGNVSGTLSREDSIRAAMRNATPTLTINDNEFTFYHLTPGTVNWLAGSGNPGDVTKVKVTHHWELMTPFASEFFSSNMITLKVESAMLSEPRFD